MANQPVSTVENNFTKGLVTEFTGLNFPENAATDADNTEFSIVGDTTRRLGINYESHFSTRTQDRLNCAIVTYKWNNVGGDGTTQIVVEQVGAAIRFYKSSSATATSPLSAQLLVTTIALSDFLATGSTLSVGDVAKLECQFADGNGYLFIYHPSCDPVYCTYVAGTVTGTRVVVKVRDFTGIPEIGLGVNTRPTTLSAEHEYNLNNQGWTSGAPWGANSIDTKTLNIGSMSFQVQAGIAGVGIGSIVNLLYQPVVWPVFTSLYPGVVASGNVTSYAGTTMVVNITDGIAGYMGSIGTGWALVPRTVTGYISGWNTAIGNYPSNADVWWNFKNATDVFTPATTINNVTLGTGNAPRGHFIMDAFSQQRSLLSSVAGLTPTVTTARPTLGAWFQGRVWYAGVDAQQAASGDAPYYTWTENIYFSQTIVDNTEFGNCYQYNDPTSETLFDLLPTDGGVIKIQGCGKVYKLFPIQNGMLVFAANGIWFITGSQGIGFAANDYTITKISAIQSISSTSFVNVQGLPYFWNEEGIYTVTPGKQGGLTVDPITVTTILSMYDQIPVSSKAYARGDYNPIDYVIQWVYKDTEATNITDRYSYNKILNFNTYNKAFYPYTLNITNSQIPVINGVIYVNHPGGVGAPTPTFKYPCSVSNTVSYDFTFAEERDTNYFDWNIAQYESYFITGFKLHGQGQKRFQVPYIYVFSRTDGGRVSYKIQGLWDYAISGNSGRWSTAQITNINEPNFGMVFRRHKIRGQGLVLQFKIKSVSGQPFDVMGWSTYETVNTGV